MDLPSQGPINNTTESVKKGDNTADKSGEPEIKASAGVVVNLPQPSKPPPSPPNGGGAHDGNDKLTNKEWKWVELSTLIVEILGFGGLIWYCVVSQKELNVFDSERKTMETEAIMGQRAWVSAEPKEIVMVGPFTAFVQVHVINTGKTPAFNVSNVVTCAGPLKLYSNIISKPDDLPQRGSGMIPPGQDSILHTSPIDRTLIEDCFVKGTVWYDDIFGKHHWSQFCYFTTNGQFAATPDHNTSDDAKADNRK